MRGRFCALGLWSSRYFFCTEQLGAALPGAALQCSRIWARDKAAESAKRRCMSGYVCSRSVASHAVVFWRLQLGFIPQLSLAALMILAAIVLTARVCVSLCTRLVSRMSPPSSHGASKQDKKD